MGWSGWKALDGTTGNACTSFASKGKLYLFASGLDDKKIYFRSHEQEWTLWSLFGGTSNAPVAVAEFDDAYHFFRKGLDNKIYVRSTQSIPGSSQWQEFGGTTDAALSAVSFGDQLHVFAKGKEDNKIYTTARSRGGQWAGWREFGGTTDVAPSTVVYRNALYIFARRPQDKKLHVRSLGGSGGTAWLDMGVRSGSPVAAAHFAGDLHLFAKGLNDDHIYSMIVGRSNLWSTWYPLTPEGFNTNEPLSVSRYSNNLILFRVDPVDNQIYRQAMFIYNLPFDDDGEWTLDVGNFDEPGGGHTLGGQMFDFDFSHPEGGIIRAVRSGKVIFIENNPWNNVNPDSPIYNPLAPQGWGTAIHIRHDDGATSAYMHLKFQSTRVECQQQVVEGQIIALSGDTGQSHAPHLHFGIQCSANFANDCKNSSLNRQGLHIPVYFKDKAHSAWRPVKGDPLASNTS